MAYIICLTAAALVVGVMATEKLTDGNMAELNAMLNKDFTVDLCTGKTVKGTVKNVQRKEKSQTHAVLTIDFATTAGPKKDASGTQFEITKYTLQGKKWLVTSEESSKAANKALGGCDGDQHLLVAGLIKLAGTPS